MLRRLGPLFAAGLLVLGGLLSIILQLFVFPGNTRQADWERAAEHVVEALEERDVVRVHPTWNEDGLPYLTRVGNQLHRHHWPLVEDIQHIERIWIISETGRVKEALERLPFTPEAVETLTFETITLLRVDVPAWARLPASLHDQLATARVTRRAGNAVEDCRIWEAGQRRWYCARRDQTFYVGSVLAELDDDPRRCIWAHPVKDQVLRVEFNDVPLGDVLRIRAGLDLRGTRFERTGPVDYRVFIDEELVTERRISPHDASWHPQEFDTTLHNRASAQIALEVEAEDIRQRRFCFNGWVLDKEQAQRSTRKR